MAVDAVFGEPVSKPKFPVNREINRDSSPWKLPSAHTLQRFFTLRTPVPRCSLLKMGALEQGIYFELSGNFRPQNREL